MRSGPGTSGHSRTGSGRTTAAPQDSAGPPWCLAHPTENKGLGTWSQAALPAARLWRSGHGCGPRPRARRRAPGDRPTGRQRGETRAGLPRAHARRNVAPELVRTLERGSRRPAGSLPGELGRSERDRRTRDRGVSLRGHRNARVPGFEQADPVAVAARTLPPVRPAGGLHARALGAITPRGTADRTEVASGSVAASSLRVRPDPPRGAPRPGARSFRGAQFSYSKERRRRRYNRAGPPACPVGARN